MQQRQHSRSFALLRVQSRCLGLGATKELADVAVLVVGSLRQGLGHNGPLLELDAQAQMDDGMIRALVYASQHFIGYLCAREDVLLNNGLVAPDARLAPEELKKGVVSIDAAMVW